MDGWPLSQVPALVFFQASDEGKENSILFPCVEGIGEGIPDYKGILGVLDVKIGTQNRISQKTAARLLPGKVQSYLHPSNVQEALACIFCGAGHLDLAS